MIIILRSKRFLKVISFVQKCSKCTFRSFFQNFRSFFKIFQNWLNSSYKNSFFFFFRFRNFPQPRNRDLFRKSQPFVVHFTILLSCEVVRLYLTVSIPIPTLATMPFRPSRTKQIILQAHFFPVDFRYTGFFNFLVSV